MDIRLKPLKDQVIVLTGASNGIGLVTARMAAQRGARLMLTSRNETALLQLTQELNGSESVAGVAAFVAGDIAEEDVVRGVGSQAIARFGRIDTWINCAGVSIYEPVLDVSLEDQLRLFGRALPGAKVERMKI